MEKRITFTSGVHLLEGLLNCRSKSHGAIITHPHPLYGGDMSNPVVESLAMSFNKKNYTTLRFNFRGTGRSEGRYDEGIGEQEDILAAINFLREESISSIQLIGYSFGAWVIAELEDIPQEIEGLLFVSPPVALLPYHQDRTYPLLKLVITGEEDEIAPVELIEKSLPRWNPTASFKVVDFADHFFYGSFTSLDQIILDYLSKKTGLPLTKAVRLSV